LADELRAALIGCGSWGRQHALSAQALPDLRMVAFCDLREERAEAYCAEFGGQYATADAERVFADPAVEAVFIATTHDTHRPLAVAAARAGKHVFLEKPMAMNVTDARAIRDAVREAGVQMQIGFKYRHAPMVRRVREFLPHPRLVVGQVMDTPWSDESWTMDPARGGGNIISQACHNLDTVCLLAGAEPVEVHAHGGNLLHPGSPLIDTVAASIQFANGSVAAVVNGDAGEAGHTSKFFFEVFDGQRSASLFDRCHQAMVWRKDGDREHWTAEDLAETERDDLEGTCAQVRAFVECVRSGRPCSAGADDGVRAAALTDAIIESIASGKRVAITDD
jgi:myo-inositol 2-dehydrogenase/D-chiro-inositol 1-dehydrogenase